jgi:hypothetical protein
MRLRARTVWPAQLRAGAASTEDRATTILMSHGWPPPLERLLENEVAATKARWLASLAC